MQTQADDKAREHKDRGTQLLSKGKLADALAEFQKAVAAAPRDAVARRKVAELLGRLGRNADAVKEYQLLVGRFAAEGRLLEAIALSKVILQLDPAHVETQTALSKLYAQRSSSSGIEKMPASMSGAIDFTHSRAAQSAAARKSSSPGAPAAQPEVFYQSKNVPEIELDAAELPQTPLFSELPPEVMQVLLERLTMQPYQKDEVIMREGDVGRSLFVIASGSVKVVRKDGKGEDQLIDKMKEGTFFGEIGLIADVPRVATVIAEEDTVLLEVPRELIRKLNEKFPGLDELVRNFYKRRLLENLVRVSPIFKPLTAQEQTAIVNAFQVHRATEGEVLLKQGSAGRGLFLILRGRCSVSFRDAGGAEHQLPEMSEGQVMGEISLITGSAVTATVTAVTPSILLFLDPGPFVEYMMSNPAARHMMNVLSQERLKRTDSIEEKEAQIEPAFL